ncbi:unnamed protein product [Chrysoparadoxa australica]
MQVQAQANHQLNEQLSEPNGDGYTKGPNGLTHTQQVNTSQQIEYELLLNWDLLRSDVEECIRQVKAERQQSLVFEPSPNMDMVVAQLDQLAQRFTQEVEEHVYRSNFERGLKTNREQEACVQGEWRQEPFPVRQYKRYLGDYAPAEDLGPMDSKEVLKLLDTDLADGYRGESYRCST